VRGKPKVLNACHAARRATGAMYVHHFVVPMTAAKDEVARGEALGRLCRRPEADGQGKEEDQGDDQGDDQEKAGPA